jgi:hypothetical protein
MKKQTWQEVEAEPEIEPIALDESDAFAWKLQLETPFLPSYPLHQKCVRDVVRAAIRKRLNEHQARVLFMLFGLDSGQERTAPAVAKILGCSVSSVCSTRDRAFAKLRQTILLRKRDLGIERITPLPPPAPPITAQPVSRWQNWPDVEVEMPSFACRQCCGCPCICVRTAIPEPISGPSPQTVRWAGVIATKTNWRRAPCSPPPTT